MWKSFKDKGNKTSLYNCVVIIFDRFFKINLTNLKDIQVTTLFHHSKKVLGLIPRWMHVFFLYVWKFRQKILFPPIVQKVCKISKLESVRF